MNTVCVYKDPMMYGAHGIASAVNHQRKALQLHGVQVKDKPREPYDIIHINWPGPISYLRLKQAQRRGKPGIVFVHAGREIEKGFTLSQYISKPLVNKLWLSRIYSSADIVIAPTEYAKAKMSNFGVGPDKIRVVSNGVDFSRIEYSQQERRRFRERYDMNRPTVITIGQVKPRKDVTTFVEVARELPQYQFFWFGQKIDWSSLFGDSTDDVIYNSPDNVRFTGYVEDIDAALSSGDLFFFPSKEENEAIVLLEAAGHGLPIVTRNLPAYKDLLVDGQSCLKGNNTDEFVELIKKAMEENEVRGKLTENAKEAAEEYSLENVGKKYLEVYKEFSEQQRSEDTLLKR
ncbi:MAG: glycosyltransferase family 4 protein [Candidatus Bipolaricaulota bacterium]|nr:glycosyltransferase family 4 protein [Candidatus Bipolaricaulota bacterium]MBS3791424.1 glycosyltransferase family 4 protein [Candidatus Bipolaricaulota bacterium]